MSVPHPARSELRPSVADEESKRFMRNVSLSWEADRLVAVDVDGRKQAFSGAHTIMLQTDLQVGVRSLHGTHDLLLVLDEKGHVLVEAPRRPFDERDVAEFCRAHGLELVHTERTYKQPAMPPRAKGHQCLDVPRRTSAVVTVVFLTSVALGLLGPFNALVVIGIGAVLAFALLIVLT